MLALTTRVGANPTVVYSVFPRSVPQAAPCRTPRDLVWRSSILSCALRWSASARPGVLHEDPTTTYPLVRSGVADQSLDSAVRRRSGEKLELASYRDDLFGHHTPGRGSERAAQLVYASAFGAHVNRRRCRASDARRASQPS